MYKTPSIFNAMDELFEFANHNSSTYSKTDIRQTEDGFTLDILLPGFAKDEVQVRTEGDVLILEAKSERDFPKFLNRVVKKSYQVENLAAESVSAKLEAGVLRVAFTTEKKKNTRNISIL